MLTARRPDGDAFAIVETSGNVQIFEKIGRKFYLLGCKNFRCFIFRFEYFGRFDENRTIVLGDVIDPSQRLSTRNSKLPLRADDCELEKLLLLEEEIVPSECVT